MRRRRRPFNFFWEDEPWDRMIGDLSRGFSSMGSGFPVDMSETEEKVIIRADLPGIEKKNVSARIVDNTIVIDAEQQEEEREEDEDYFRQERRYGKLHREIPLPVEVDDDKVEARMEDGVLTIEVPKKEKNKRKGREVKID